MCTVLASYPPPSFPLLPPSILSTTPLFFKYYSYTLMSSFSVAHENWLRVEHMGLNELS